MSETLDEFMRRLHCGHTGFDELATWHYRLRAELEAARRVVEAARAFRSSMMFMPMTDGLAEAPDAAGKRLMCEMPHVIPYKDAPPTHVDPLGDAIAEYDRERKERGE